MRMCSTAGWPTACTGTICRQIRTVFTAYRSGVPGTCWVRWRSGPLDGPIRKRRRMPEWEFAGEIARGARGAQAKLVQEWLSLHDLKVVVDGRYGPATAEAVQRFQGRQGLAPTGNVDAATFDRLVQPLTTA